ncbi:MAG: alkaline phosphatase family protein [Acidobacteria bacterium]|nr:alkaline phosphatase family protein [Acidobacteriota bacterium]
MAARLLLSSALAAAIFAADVVLLTLFLNPAVRPPEEAPALLAALFAPYALAGTVALWTLALLAAALRGWPRAPRPPVEGLPFFATLSFLAITASAALYWTNLLGYRHSIPLEFVRTLVGSAVALTAAALVLVAVGVDARLYPHRGRGLSAALVVMAGGAAVVVPLALRPVPAPAPHPVPLATETVEPARRVILLGIDGLGVRQIEEGISAGRFPAFARLMGRRRGAGEPACAWGPLATLRPTEGPPVWTTLVTGRLPRDHGIKSFVTYRLVDSRTPYELLPRGAFVGLLERAGLVSRVPVASRARKRRALWNVLNAFGIPTGVVRIWATNPAERVQGFMLSPYFHLLRHEPARAAETLFPPDLFAEASARAVDPQDVDRALLSQFVDLSPGLGADPVPWRRELVERALAPDMTYQRAGAVLRAAYDPPFFATYVYGLDPVGHTFTRFARPDLFGDVGPEQVRRYGRVLDRYAAYVNQIVAEAVQGLRRGEVLLVVSGYGMEAVPLWRRILGGVGLGPETSATHAGAPDGVIFVVGEGVQDGATIRGASVLDVAPTILYLMGLPVARDMEGRALTEVLAESEAPAVTFIPSYESLAVTPVTGGQEVALPPLPEEEP